MGKLGLIFSQPRCAGAREWTNSENGPSVTQPPPPPDLMMFGVRPDCGTPLYVGSGWPLPPRLEALPLSSGESSGFCA